MGKRKDRGETIDREKRYRLTSRMLGYLARYRFRLIAGLVFSLFASFSNLFSITAFVPIFNTLGKEGRVTLFQIGGEEKQRYVSYVNGDSQPFYIQIAAMVTGWKYYANEYVKDKSSREVIYLITLFVLPLYGLKLVSVTATIYFIGTAGLLAVRDLREELYVKMNRLGLDYFSRERTGLVMSRVINDVEVVGKSFSTEFSEATINFFYVITHLGLLAAISWKMLLVTILIAPLTGAPVSRLAKTIRRVTIAQQEWLAQMGAHLQEVLGGIRVIRAFSMEEFEKKRFRPINENLYQNTFQVHYHHQFGPAITEFIATFIVLGFLTWGAYSISNGDLSKALFFAFFFTLIFIMRPLKQLSIMVNLFSTALGAADRIFETIDMKESIVEKKNARSFPGLKNQIEIKNVSFTYPESEEPALHQINLEVKQGMTVSIVGPSGAGKSTLMDLIPRFYDTGEGSVSFDGVDVRDFKLRELRTKIGIVTQNIFLFNATIGENIAYGRKDVGMDQIIEVARAANAHDFIEQLPEGYNTLVGERGVMLSGGQRQRIAIARALLHNPPVLIFDEATSALDNESEKAVQEAMERLREGRTVFIIAHRLSTVYRSDLILVMQDGKIVERGTHRELVEDSTVYKKLYELQFQNQSNQDLP